MVRSQGRSRKVQSAAPVAPLTNAAGVAPAAVQLPPVPVSEAELKVQRAALQRQLTKTKFCVYFTKGQCQYGKECAFAHTDEELRSSPDLRKTRLCMSFVDGQCNDPKCPFAHGEDDLRSTDMFFKKSLCSWHAKGKCRNGAGCRFAHGAHELQQHQDANTSAHPSASVAAPHLGARHSCDEDLLRQVMRLLNQRSAQAPQAPNFTSSPAAQGALATTPVPSLAAGQARTALAQSFQAVNTSSPNSQLIFGAPNASSLQACQFSAVPPPRQDNMLPMKVLPRGCSNQGAPMMNPSAMALENMRRQLQQTIGQVGDSRVVQHFQQNLTQTNLPSAAPVSGACAVTAGNLQQELSQLTMAISLLSTQCHQIQSQLQSQAPKIGAEIIDSTASGGPSDDCSSIDMESLPWHRTVSGGSATSDGLRASVLANSWFQA